MNAVVFPSRSGVCVTTPSSAHQAPFSKPPPPRSRGAVRMCSRSSMSSSQRPSTITRTTVVLTTRSNDNIAASIPYFIVRAFIDTTTRHFAVRRRSARCAVRTAAGSVLTEDDQAVVEASAEDLTVVERSTFLAEEADECHHNHNGNQPLRTDKNDIKTGKGRGKIITTTHLLGTAVPLLLGAV
eukprot:2060076-Pyramimonas_sp.AAC.1